MKRGTNICHVSGHRWKGFQGQRSKVEVVARWNALVRQRDIQLLIAFTAVCPSSRRTYW